MSGRKEALRQPLPVQWARREQVLLRPGRRLGGAAGLGRRAGLAAAMAGAEGGAEPLGRSRAELAWVEALRGDCEPEQHWRHRREFLLRNVAAPPPAPGSAELQRLVSLSMVWANYVFLGCR